MSPTDQDAFAGLEDRLRQLRRRRGIPNGVSLADAVVPHMLSADEVERAYWGADGDLTANRLVNPDLT